MMPYIINPLSTGSYHLLYAQELAEPAFLIGQYVPTLGCQHVLHRKDSD